MPDETNPFLRRLAAQGSMGHGGVSETRVAKSLNARLQPASGARKGAKGDMRFARGNLKYRLEAKSTIQDSIHVKLEWLVKIAHEATAGGEIPVLSVSFVTPEGKPRSPRNATWMMVPSEFFQEMLDELAEKSSS